MIDDLQGCVDVIQRVHTDYPGFGFGHLVVWQCYYGMGNEAAAVAAAARHFRITRGDPTGAEVLESDYRANDFAAATARAAEVLIENTGKQRTCRQLILLCCSSNQVGSSRR